MSYQDEEGIGLVSDTAVADLSAVTATTLYTVPAGKVFVATEVWLRSAADVGGSLAFTIGRSTALTDFVGTTNGDNLDVAGDCILVKPVPSATPATNKSYAAGVIIQFKVSVAGNGVAGRVFLFGFLYDA